MNTLTALIDQHVSQFSLYQPTSTDLTINDLCEYRDCDLITFRNPLQSALGSSQNENEIRTLYNRLASMAHGILSNYALAQQSTDIQNQQRATLFSFCTSLTLRLPSDIRIVELNYLAGLIEADGSFTSSPTYQVLPRIVDQFGRILDEDKYLKNFKKVMAYLTTKSYLFGLQEADKTLAYTECFSPDQPSYVPPPLTKENVQRVIDSQIDLPQRVQAFVSIWGVHQIGSEGYGALKRETVRVVNGSSPTNLQYERGLADQQRLFYWLVGQVPTVNGANSKRLGEGYRKEKVEQMEGIIRAVKVLERLTPKKCKQLVRELGLE